MLVIGSTFADAAAFLGHDIGPGAEAAMAFNTGPRRAERASTQVPDALWPPGEFFMTWLRGADFTNENGSAPYDAVIVTAGAMDAIDAEHRDANEVLGGTARGWIWIDGKGEMGPGAGAAKAGDLRAFIVEGRILSFTAGERVDVSTP